MKISKEKRDKIAEHILSILYLNSPSPIYTSHIAREVARDEEFIKKILIDLKKKNLIIQIKKNSKGEPYIRRSRWKLSDQAYNAYKNHHT